MTLISGLEAKLVSIEMVESILSQREEILKAFIAKHGFDPENSVQVFEKTEKGFRWYISSKERLGIT